MHCSDPSFLCPDFFYCLFLVAYSQRASSGNRRAPHDCCSSTSTVMHANAWKYRSNLEEAWIGNVGEQQD
ncbi:hypothetical protein DAI22_02g057200 [Oryza sativa Japonica Group]|nr:hypothetical protein DAI22_02g057200 [Oryza sativa Japonica Group]